MESVKGKTVLATVVTSNHGIALVRVGERKQCDFALNLGDGDPPVGTQVELTMNAARGFWTFYYDGCSGGSVATQTDIHKVY